MAMTSPTASRFWVATFNDGKYDAASLPSYVKNLATATDGGAKVRPKLFDYRKKVQALHAFASVLPSHDLVLFLDADVRTFGDTRLVRVEGLARALLRQASADVVLGAELGRYEMPPYAQFWIPSWAHEACPKTIADLHGLAACRQRKARAAASKSTSIRIAACCSGRRGRCTTPLASYSGADGARQRSRAISTNTMTPCRRGASCAPRSTIARRSL